MTFSPLTAEAVTQEREKLNRRRQGEANTQSHQELMRQRPDEGRKEAKTLFQRWLRCVRMACKERFNRRLDRGQSFQAPQKEPEERCSSGTQSRGSQGRRLRGCKSKGSILSKLCTSEGVGILTRHMFSELRFWGGLREGTLGEPMDLGQCRRCLPSKASGRLTPQ